MISEYDCIVTITYYLPLVDKTRWNQMVNNHHSNTNDASIAMSTLVECYGQDTHQYHNIKHYH